MQTSEHEETYKNYDFFIIAQDMGHRCGYVKIHKDHPVYGLHYNDMDNYYIDCHGELTYTEEDESDSDIWVIGFDCAHDTDGTDFSIQSKEYKGKSFYTSGTVWTKEMVIAECKLIIQQLITIETTTDKKTKDPEDYDVYDQDGTYLGQVELVENITWQEMPQELEINGVVYYPKF